MAHTDAHSPAAKAARNLNNPPARHSHGLSLASRGAGLHHYRDEISADGDAKTLRRMVRRTGRQAFRRDLAKGLY